MTPPKVDYEVNEPETEEYEASHEQTIFTQIELDEHWQQFNRTFLSDRPRHSSIFSNSQPILGENFVIIIEFGSQLQLDTFSEFKNELLVYLRNKLDNKSLSIDARVIPANEPKGKIYTIDDKFKYINQLNPNIEVLKKSLNLDFD